MSHPDDGTDFSDDPREPSGEGVLDFSVTVNAFGPPATLAEALAAGRRGIGRYPDSHNTALRNRLAQVYGVDADNVLVANGAGEIVYLLPRILRARRAVVQAPCSADFWRGSQLAGADVEGVVASEEHAFVPDLNAFSERLPGVDLAWLANPGDPTGVALERGAILGLAADHPAVMFAVDESLLEFMPDCAERTLIAPDLPRNILVLRDLSDFYAVPGLRLGFLVGQPELIYSLRAAMPPWNVNCFAVSAGLRLHDDAEFAECTRAQVKAERDLLALGLGSVRGLRPFDSAANFLLVKIDPAAGLAAAGLKARLESRGILVCNGAGFRALDGSFLRVLVRTRAENQRLMAELRNILQG